jgi:hypothetical protein
MIYLGQMIVLIPINDFHQKKLCLIKLHDCLDLYKVNNEAI